MALDPHYITSSDLESYFVDKDTGLPLAAGTIDFFEDSDRIERKPIYELTGSPPNYTYTELSNPMTLSSVGTPQNDGGDNVTIYYKPYDSAGELQLYYIVVKDSNGVEQFTREAWPNEAALTPGPDGVNSLPAQNQISNPQFTRLFINEGQSIVFTPASATVVEYQFGPDWYFEITGLTGSVTVSRVAEAGSQQIETSPPYVLDVTVDAGITACYLRQRFYKNSGLWSSTSTNNIVLSTGILARTITDSAVVLFMFYRSSEADPTYTPIFANTINSTTFKYYNSGSSGPMPESLDPNTGTSGYVDILILFPQSSHVQVSSVQVVPVFESDAGPIVPYDETSANRDQALMGDYYIPRLETKPIASLLTAWDFPLNPAQLGATVATTAVVAEYVWDQTIVQRSAAGNVAVARNSTSNAIQFSPAANNGAFYMMQFLSGAQAKELLYTRLSSNIQAYLGAGGGTVTTQVYLYVGTAASAFGTLPTAFGAISNTGVFSGAPANWTIVPRSGLDTPKATLSTSNPTVDKDVSFTGWELSSAQISDTDKVAMIVTFAWDTATVINVNSISLNKGDIPTRPAPQTPSDVLSECQYYYEQSFATNSVSAGIGVPAANAVSPICRTQSANGFGASTQSWGPRTFGIEYKIKKRVAPTLVFYSGTSATAANVTFTVYNNGASFASADEPLTSWTQTLNGTSSVYYLSTKATNIGSSGGFNAGTTDAFIIFHYLAEARLGKV